ncbi:multiple sugar transport system permease protein [Kribbella orskensis]|uniref:Multiple sugar transport system permease protein n=1 Tax=Kribbella orskensis TaxID=2512216 RepID=A0ABY2BE28_9ACTN|nr:MULTISPECIES: carbohydrate ABC transporter permease [Kribbella]TCN34863.1 multiple sugar transport system permease protein [Kribbella sp. VKM Ac-2500]TCO15569.1 multiple sugar transport system permease protein [Kribbella orskensis]
MRRTWWIYLIAVLGLIAVAAPFAWMFLGSFKTQGELLRVPPTWLPEAPTSQNYDDLFSKANFPQYFVNSAIVAIAVTAGNLIFCSMVGYSLAKLRFRGRNALFVLVLATLMIPGVVTFVPLFVLVTNAGLANSYPGLILPFLVSPFGVFLMRQFFSGLPDDLMDAGRVDGTSELGIFARIMLPLTRPALATLGILTFLGSWNNFLWPLVIAQTEEMYTLPVALALYSTGQNAQNYGLLMAGAVVVVVPVLVIFLVFQRHVTRGIAITGLK